MLKKILIIFLLSTQQAYAVDKDKLINFELQKAPLVDVIKMFLQSVVESEYIIDPAVESIKTPITISVKDKTKKQALHLFNELIERNSIHIKTIGGVYYVSLKDEKTLYQSQTKELQNIKQQIVEEIQPTPEQQQYDNQTARIIDKNDIQIDLPLDMSQVITPNLTIYKPKTISAAKLQEALSFANIRSKVVNGVLLYDPKNTNNYFISDLLKQLDGYDSDIIIKATILEYQTTDQSQTGIQTIFNLLKNTLSFATPSLNFNGSELSIKTKNLDAMLRIITSNDHFKVLASPTLRVANNQRSIINVGNEVPVLQQAATNANGQIIESIDYRPTGITLDVTPRIYANNVQLNILQNVSEVVPTTTGVRNNPTISQRKLSTTLNTKSGQTIVIGGLNRQIANKNKTGFLGIPIGKSSSQTTTDLILMLNITKT